MRTCTAVLLLILGYRSAAQTPDAAEIMAKVAGNVEAGAEARRLFVYQQQVRASLVRSNGQVARREKREYAVTPGEKGTDKRLVSFQGEYGKGKQLIPYSEPGFEHKNVDVDADLIDDLTNDLVNDQESRDGIPHSLFPLRTKDLASYKFSWTGETTHKGRRTHQIAFEPVRKKTCLDFDSDDGGCRAWKGEVWIDAEEFQPVRIDTHLAFQIPWGVRVFLGTNLRQTGFAISYVRVGENVWFPATYGTEFRVNVLWGYKRTITLAMESSGFRKTDVNSTVAYELPQ